MKLPLEESESGEPNWEETSQNVTTAGSAGSAAWLDPDPVEMYTDFSQSNNVQRERLASSRSSWSRALRSRVLEVSSGQRHVGTAWAVGEPWRDLLPGPGSPPSKLALSDPWALPLVLQEAFLHPPHSLALSNLPIGLLESRSSQWQSAG